jgi:SpoVK/Ycf46/Vps4 family AAA+-type ATPase
MSKTLTGSELLRTVLLWSTNCKLCFCFTLYASKMEGVKKVLQGTITDMDITDLEQETLVVEEIFRCLKIKKSKAPKRPKRIILLGPPGSQKERYAEMVAEKYKLVNVRVSQLVTDHIRREERRDYAEQLRRLNQAQS